MDMDRDYIYIPDRTHNIILIFNREGTYQNSITIKQQLVGRLNYFKKLQNGYLIYNNYTLLLINTEGEILHKRSYPTGCIPSFLNVYNNYITIVLPKVFNKDNNTEVLEQTTLNPLGILHKRDRTPTTLSKEGIIPIKIINDNKEFYFIDCEKYFFWIDFESNTILKTNNELKIVSSTVDREISSGFKSYILLDNNIYSIREGASTIIINEMSGDF